MSNKRVTTVRLIWLESFVEVAKQGTYKGAGDALKIDPTNVKSYISDLEEWLGRSLLLKSSKNPKLSEDGSDFLPKATTIIDILYNSRDFMIDAGNMKDMGKQMSTFFAKHMRAEGL